MDSRVTTLIETVLARGAEGALRSILAGAGQDSADQGQGPADQALATVVRQNAHLLDPLEPPGSITPTLASRIPDAGVTAGIGAAITATLRGPRLTPAHPLPDLPHPALTTVLTGHTGPVRELVAAPDGRWLASADWDGAVRVWDPVSGTLQHALVGHTDQVLALAAAPDGSWLASAGKDATVRIWDPTTGTQLHASTDRIRGIRALVAAPDGSWLASAGDDGTVRVWDPTTSDLLHTLDGPTGYPTLAASPDGAWLAGAGAGADGAIRFWEPATGTPLRTMTGHTDAIWQLIVTPDGHRLASAGKDGACGCGTPSPTPDTRSSPATPPWSAPWPPPRTAAGSPPRASTGRYGSGTWPPCRRPPRPAPPDGSTR